MCQTTLSRSFVFTAARGALLASLTIIPFGAFADDPPAKGEGGSPNSSARSGQDNKLADRKVTLQVEEASLTDAIRMLMKSVGADFSIDPGLREARVTVNLTNIRLGVALDLLMKVSTIPATYRVESGVYLFEVRKEEPVIERIVPEEPKPETKQQRLETIRLRYADASYIASLFGGQPFSVMGQNYGYFGGDFSGSKSFSNSGIGGFGGFTGGGTVILGNQGNGFGQNGFNNGGNSQFHFNNGFYNLFNNLMLGGGNRRR